MGAARHRCVWRPLEEERYRNLEIDGVRWLFFALANTKERPLLSAARRPKKHFQQKLRSQSGTAPGLGPASQAVARWDAAEARGRLGAEPSAPVRPLI